MEISTTKSELKESKGKEHKNSVRSILHCMEMLEKGKQGI